MNTTVATPVSRSVQHLDMIRSVVGADRTVAQILDVSPAQVSRWRKGQTPDLENADRLAGLALVVEMLARWIHPDTVEGWLDGINAHLGDRTPAYLLRRGQVAEVIGAIELERAGTFA